jgi:hypothetical protein
MSLYRRRYTAAERKGDEQGMHVASRCWWGRWDRIVMMLSNPGEVMNGELPATMAEELRREGLL